MRTRLVFRGAAILSAALVGMSFAGCQSKPANDNTAAGQVNSPPFQEVTTAAGIHYQWVIPDKRPLNILQTIGNGCAFLDYDGDGNLDILLVGSPLALYKGDGKGHFTDVTRETGLDTLKGHFLGCAVGDYDNDGFPDIYLTAYRGGTLLHNESAAHHSFRAVSLPPQPWGTSATFAETVPGSGRLDLIVANYAQFGQEAGILQLCEEKSAQGMPLMTSCGPRHYTPLKAVLFRNRGKGNFAAPITLSSLSGRGLGVAACDFDGSGRQGIAFANDEISGDLLQNQGNGTFANIGMASGTAYDRDGNVHGGMGLDWGDYDNDGRFDLFVATFQNEAKSLYHNEGSRVFTDESYPSGLGSLALPSVTFGCKFLDYDNDGWLDVAIANGHVQDNIADIDPRATYRQAFQLCRNRGMGDEKHVTFENIPSPAGAKADRPLVGRGLASGDYDNDGRVDLLVVDSEGSPLLLHNEVKSSHHCLGLHLVGSKSNRDGYGAIVTVKAGGRTLTRLCHADGSYMSSSDPRLLVGLGTANSVEELTIHWSSGQTNHLSGVAIDRYVTVREGEKL